MPMLVPSPICASWPVHPQDALIGPSDEPVEVPPFPGFNVDLKKLPELQHVKLESCVGPRLGALQSEVSRLDITQAETIFNAAFPSAIRYDDPRERFMYYGRHNSIPQGDWEEGWVDLPELEVVTMEIFNAMSRTMTLPLQILSVTTNSFHRLVRFSIRIHGIHIIGNTGTCTLGNRLPKDRGKLSYITSQQIKKETIQVRIGLKNRQK